MSKWSIDELQKQNEKLKEELLEKEKKIKELQQMIPHYGGSISIRHGLNDPVSFLQRINRTFVNAAGDKYLEFEFYGTQIPAGSSSLRIMDNKIRYYDGAYAVYDCFSTVQYDMNEIATPLVLQRGVSLPVRVTPGLSLMADYITKDLSHTSYNATKRSFIFQDFCFIGHIRKVEDNFRNNHAVSLFLNNLQMGIDVGWMLLQKPSLFSKQGM